MIQTAVVVLHALTLLVIAAGYIVSALPDEMLRRLEWETLVAGTLGVIGGLFAFFGVQQQTRHFRIQQKVQRSRKEYEINQRIIVYCRNIRSKSRLLNREIIDGIRDINRNNPYAHENIIDAFSEYDFDFFNIETDNIIYIKKNIKQQLDEIETDIFAIYVFEVPTDPDFVEKWYINNAIRHTRRLRKIAQKADRLAKELNKIQKEIFDFLHANA